MKKLGWIVAACFVLMSSWRISEFSSQQVLNALLLGRKAFWSFDDGTSGIVRRITKFGFNLDIDTGTPEIIGSFGGPWLQKELTAQTVSVVSTSAADSAAGTGATNLLLTCVDGNGLEVLVPVAMNGTTPVVTTQTCKFINRAVVFLTGTGDTNAGDINIIQSGSGIQLAQIPTAKSSTQQILFYVPSNMRCYMDDIFIKVRKLSGGGNPKVQLNVLIYSMTQDTFYDVREFYVDTSVGYGIIRQNDFKAEVIRPNEILTITAITDTNNTISTASLDLTCKVD